MKLIDAAITPDKVTGDLLQLLYIPLPVLANLDEVLTKGNPKKHEIDKLRASIAQNGFIDPAKWDANLNSGKGGIIYGNGRTEALVAMLLDMKGTGQSPPRGIGVHEETGEWCIPIKFGVDAKSETAAKRFIVDHNLLTASGLNVVDASAMFETEAYLELLEELKEQDALPLTVSEENYLALIGSSDGGGGGDGKDDALDPTEMEIRDGLVPGSIWQLGRHKIMCGDSTDEGNVRKLLGDRFNEVGMIWADVPYGYSYQSNRRTKTKKFDVIKNDDIFLDGFIYPLLKTSGWFCICTTWKVLGKWMEISSPLGDLTNLIVWDKGGGGMGDLTHSLSTDYELIMAFGRGSEIYGKRIGSVWDIGKDNPSGYQHPTQKPVELLNQAFEVFSRDNCLIFDPFIGSAPGIAAAQLMPGKRTVYGMELEPGYIEIACQRYERLTGDTAKLVGS